MKKLTISQHCVDKDLRGFFSNPGGLGGANYKIQNFTYTFGQETISVNQLLYRLNYFDAPVVKEKSEDHLMLESIQNKVWNPVFTVGVITFVLSMTLRGFFDQQFAVIPLGLSTFVLFAGIWKLSSAALVVFDKNDSKVYFIYKHLGYLQKIYVHALTSFDELELIDLGNGKFRLQLLKDDGTQVKVAERKEKVLLQNTAKEIASSLNLPVKS
jgi:hypothetical protein